VTATSARDARCQPHVSPRTISPRLAPARQEVIGSDRNLQLLLLPAGVATWSPGGSTPPGNGTIGTISPDAIAEASSGVGWVEPGETHHVAPSGSIGGFRIKCSTHPTCYCRRRADTLLCRRAPARRRSTLRHPRMRAAWSMSSCSCRSSRPSTPQPTSVIVRPGRRWPLPGNFRRKAVRSESRVHRTRVYC
jgi:hypothetical protein